MSDKRVFTQPVWMNCESELQQAALKGALLEWGYKWYDKYEIDYSTYPVICTFFDANPSLACVSMHDPNDNGRHEWDSRYIGLETFNPDLFLALAACSAGPEFWPGEYGVSLKTLNGTGHVKQGELYKIQSVSKSNGIQIEDEWVKGGGEKGGWTLPENFRKATVEEIIAHFARKEIKPGADEQLNEDLIHGVDPQNEENYMLNRDCKREWTPEFGELVQVWDSPTGNRYNRFFLGVNKLGETLVCEGSPHEFNVDPGRITAWKNHAKFGAAVEVPFSEVARVFAKEYNVFPEQIKIV